ncbi:hypothetical protein F1654_10205 [Alkalicaulis satelles]|uniref:DUF2269 family protein n=1 Tax=Alkalicaulis satelles TaxID=2609175 RepID=A0A5M6ZD15_9PROT|nr:hypothetical protein [Alkalicaulis satelles]KAA5802205.1 hypothetical protein F1654_10205 [Alkalicaulis satelles]
MIETGWLYDALLYAHIVLFAVWLGGDIGVFILGQHFRKRSYQLETRLQFLKLLVLNDMGPRSAWALMVPVSLSLIALNWTDLPGWIVTASWAAGLVWLALVWGAYLNDQTPLAAQLRRIEFALKLALTAGFIALTAAGPAGWLAMPGWLTLKAGLFAAIFVFAIMIDVSYRPVGPLLQRLITQGSSDETEIPLLRAMNRTRLWVLGLYGLLIVIGAVGVFKPVF